MTYKKYLTLFYIFCLANTCFATNFGEYNYSKYIGLQQQLNTQRAISNRTRMRYSSSPTRNIKYPTSNNPYPNIQKTNVQQPISAKQRYSVNYYQNHY